MTNTTNFGLPLTQERLRELLSYDPYTGIFRWRMSRPKVSAGMVAGNVSKREGVVRITIDYKSYWGHHLAWLYVYGELPDKGDLIDHENTVRHDNRIRNLRIANKSQNGCNRSASKNSKTGIKNVCWNKIHKKWQVRVNLNGAIVYSHLNSCFGAAIKEAKEARKTYHGEFAR